MPVPVTLPYRLLASLLIGLSTLCVWLPWAYAGPANPSTVLVQYCLDQEERTTLEQARQCQFGSFNELSSGVRYASVRWTRVTVSTQDATQTLTINVAPRLIQQIEIFDGQSGTQIAGPVGTNYPYDPEHGLLAGYTFAIDISAAGEHVYYVRMLTYGLPYSFVQASLDPLIAQDMSQQIGLGIHMGILGLLTLMSAGVYGATRSHIMGVFGLNLLVLLLSVLLGSGLLLEYLWPNQPGLNEFLFTTLFYLKPAFWVLVAQAFLAPYQTPAWYRPSCIAVYAAVFVMLLFSWAGFKDISNGLMLIVGVIVVPLLQLIAIQSTTDIRRFYQRILMLGYLIGALAIWAAVFVTLYPTDNPRLPILATRVIDYIYPVVLSGLIMFHYRETVLQLAAAKDENLKMRLGLEFEQKLREERKLMVDMLTHELKNPLASISLAVGSLDRTLGNEDTQSRRRLQNIGQSVRSMDSVIERCNFMNQLDQSTLKSNPAPLNLEELVTGVISRFVQSARVTWSIEGSNHFNADRQFLEMVLSNLIENALKYSPADSDVELTINRQSIESAVHLVIKVSNRVGDKGMPDKDAVFTRFYRHPLAHDTTGSGVGLYLAKALITLMQGRIALELQHDMIVFSVELPETISDA